MTTQTMQERFDEKFPPGSSEFCVCFEGDLGDYWDYAKPELLDFISSEIHIAQEDTAKEVRQLVLNAIGLEMNDSFEEMFDRFDEKFMDYLSSLRTKLTTKKPSL